MEGESLAAAKKALKACFGALGSEDRFGVFAFNSVVHEGQKKAHLADTRSMQRARAWIDSQNAEGGTELLQALEHIWSWGGWTDVVVITDGETGDSDRIAAMASRQKAAGTMLHILGIGSTQPSMPSPRLSTLVVADMVRCIRAIESSLVRSHFSVQSWQDRSTRFPCRSMVSRVSCLPRWRAALDSGSGSWGVCRIHDKRLPR